MVRVINPENGKKILVNTLLDGGSSLTALSNRAGKQLELKGREDKATIRSFGGNESTLLARHCEVTIQSRDGKTDMTGGVTILKDPAGGLRATNWNEYRGNWDHLKGLKLHTPLGAGRVELILGTDWNYFLRALQEKYGERVSDPVATRSPLGWTVAGPMGYSTPPGGTITPETLTNAAGITTVLHPSSTPKTGTPYKQS